MHWLEPNNRKKNRWRGKLILSAAVSHALQVMPLEAGSSASTLTLSETSRICMLLSDKQAASMEGWAGFHFRSCTKVPGGTAGSREAKGDFCCFTLESKHNQSKPYWDESITFYEYLCCTNNTKVVVQTWLPGWQSYGRHRRLGTRLDPHMHRKLTAWVHHSWEICYAGTDPQSLLPVGLSHQLEAQDKSEFYQWRHTCKKKKWKYRVMSRKLFHTCFIGVAINLISLQNVFGSVDFECLVTCGKSQAKLIGDGEQIWSFAWQIFCWFKDFDFLHLTKLEILKETVNQIPL